MRAGRMAWMGAVAVGIGVALTACSSASPASDATTTVTVTKDASAADGVGSTVTETVTQSAGQPSTVTQTAPAVTVTQPANEAGAAGGSATPACTADDLDVSLADSEGAAGSVYLQLNFRNSGSAPCAMQGFPLVSYVRGDAGTQTGAAAGPDGAAGVQVVLQPGAAATSALREVNVANFDASACDPVAVRGVRVYPPGSATAAFVAQQGVTGCQATSLPDGQRQLSVTAVTAAAG